MRRIILGLVAAALVVLGSATTAMAETGSKSDPSHDAAARIDLTKLTVKNGDKRVSFKVKVRDLRERGSFSFHYWGGTQGTPPARSAVVTVRLKDGAVKARYFECDTEQCPKAPCQGLRATWDKKKDVVTASLPQRCYPRPPANPDAPAPAVGRFFAYGSMDEVYDETPGQPLRLDRG